MCKGLMLLRRHIRSCGQKRYTISLESYALSRPLSPLFTIGPRDFGESVANRLFGMHRLKGLLSYPVCDSPVIGHLEHYLLHGRYPEFSMIRLSLLLACSHHNVRFRKPSHRLECPARRRKPLVCFHITEPIGCSWGEQKLDVDEK